jgi:hypothetical protein
MKKTFCARLLLCIVAALLAPAQFYAQTPSISQAATGSLPALPECDAILYVNARRIISEALPRILPAPLYEKMKTELDEIKRKSGIDLNGFESGVIAVRFGKPITATTDFLFVTRGTFNADALISLARIALQGKMREEKHGSKSIAIFKLSDVLGSTGAKPAPVPVPIPSGLDEMALTALDGSTLAAGSLAYLKTMMDLNGDQKRAGPDLVALAMRDPGALVSLAINIPPGLFSGLIPAEMQGSEEMMKLISGIEKFQLSVGMNATDFPLMVSLRTSSAEQARALSGILEMGIRAASSGIKDNKAQGMLDALKITTEGNDVQMQIAVPQETVATLIRDAGQTKPAAVAEAQKSDQAQKPDQMKKPAPKRARASQRKTTRARKP